MSQDFMGRIVENGNVALGMAEEECVLPKVEAIGELLQEDTAYWSALNDAKEPRFVIDSEVAELCRLAAARRQNIAACDAMLEETSVLLCALGKSGAAVVVTVQWRLWALRLAYASMRQAFDSMASDLKEMPPDVHQSFVTLSKEYDALSALSAGNLKESFSAFGSSGGACSLKAP